MNTQIQISKRERLEGPLLWIDSTAPREVLTRALQADFAGVVLHPETQDEFTRHLSPRISKVLSLEGETGVVEDPKTIYASKNPRLLAEISESGKATAYKAHVDDAASLHDAIEIGRRHDYVVMSFKDPTNIPLELVIASLQSSETVLIKEIAPNQLEDAIVTLGVMEVGAEGVLYTPGSMNELDQFLVKMHAGKVDTVDLSLGTITRIVPVGMGFRSCIDLATLFTPTEGLVIGSTSQGGLLCCPEVFYLPYMELRPFRVNAGAVHSYVFNKNNRTSYMTELKAGSPTMIVDSTGKTRDGFVGRMKTECRPLRLIEAKFHDNDVLVNALMQDDWHVRIYSDDVKPLNITELRPGDKVLGLITEPGRHVGIKVSEQILEN